MHTPLEELVITQTKVLTEVLNELREIKNLTLNDDVKTCNPQKAIAILGLNNSRYLTHFFNKGLLNRQRSGRGYVYYKAELNALAEKIASKQIVLPQARSLYEK